MVTYYSLVKDVLIYIIQNKASLTLNNTCMLASVESIILVKIVFCTMLKFGSFLMSFSNSSSVEVSDCSKPLSVPYK